ncbi:hypothetical protein K8R03_00815 [Candidatus Kaiserbacteria bacterium]|nr:hypothetical protein [Candidatus Kaiserbacteria bacterium]
MDETQGIYVIVVVLIGGAIYAIVTALPRYLVKKEIITDAEPVVRERMPTGVDYALPVLVLVSAATLPIYVLPSAFVLLAGGAYWFWRSARGAFYFKQHLNELTSGHMAALVLTNFFFYAVLGWLAQHLFHLF